MEIWVISCTNYNLVPKKCLHAYLWIKFLEVQLLTKKAYVTVPQFTLRKFMTRAGWWCKDLPASETSSKGTLQGESEGPSNPVRLWSQVAWSQCRRQWFNPLVLSFLTLEETRGPTSQGCCELIHSKLLKQYVEKCLINVNHYHYRDRRPIPGILGRLSENLSEACDAFTF